MRRDRDKAIVFLSAAKIDDVQKVLDVDADLLVSYFYIRKRKKYFIENILPQIRDKGTYFMTDSGAFSFNMAKKDLGLSFWKEYLEEYVDFLKTYGSYVYTAANLDLDAIVGREEVDGWNEKYFRPLEKLTNVVYVVQKDIHNYYGDKVGYYRLEEYMDKFSYVGLNHSSKDLRTKAVSMAKIKGKIIHGFAWTDKNILKEPVFSVDSSSWLSGQRYGTTYFYDGKNFKSYETERKHLRKFFRIFHEENNLDFTSFMNDKGKDVTKFNVIQWKGFAEEYLKVANTKLWSKNLKTYDKRRFI